MALEILLSAYVDLGFSQLHGASTLVCRRATGAVRLNFFERPRKPNDIDVHTRLIRQHPLQPSPVTCLLTHHDAPAGFPIRRMVIVCRRKLWQSSTSSRASTMNPNPTLFQTGSAREPYTRGQWGSALRATLPKPPWVMLPMARGLQTTCTFTCPRFPASLADW